MRLVQPQAATVIVEISPAPVERELKAVPVRWKNLGADLHAQVTPSVVRVTVRGAREALNALTSDGVRISSTLPASDRAGTIFGFKSSLPKTSAPPRSSRQRSQCGTMRIRGASTFDP